MSEWELHRDEPAIGTSGSPASLVRHQLVKNKCYAVFNEQSTGAIAIEYRNNGSISRKTLSKDEARVEWQRLIDEGYTPWKRKGAH